jgi:hypothetical protein
VAAHHEHVDARRALTVGMVGLVLDGRKFARPPPAECLATAARAFGVKAQAAVFWWRRSCLQPDLLERVRVMATCTSAVSATSRQLLIAAGVCSQSRAVSGR